VPALFFFQMALQSRIFSNYGLRTCICVPVCETDLQAQVRPLPGTCPYPDRHLPHTPSTVPNTSGYGILLALPFAFVIFFIDLVIRFLVRDWVGL